MADAAPKSYSVSFRLQRTTTEFAFVSVPVSVDMIIRQTDGSGRLDVPKMTARAIEMGQAIETVWEQETQDVQMHPIQMAPPNTPPSQS
jgi:hypothetical protein